MTHAHAATAPSIVDLTASLPIDPLGNSRRLALLLLAGMAVTGVAAAAFVPITGAVIGNGQIDAESHIKTVAHPGGGTIAAIYVRDGEHVRKGQPLLRLDDMVSASDSRLTSLSVVQLRARKARLEAEVAASATITFPQDLLASADPATREALANERSRFAADRAEADSLAAQANARADDYRQQIAGYRSQIQALQVQAALVRPEREAMESLYERKLVTISRYNQLERTAADIQGNIATTGAQIAGAQARVAEARLQGAQSRATRRTEASEKLSEVNDLLGQQQTRAISATDTHDRSIVRAPYDGVVDKLAFSTIGGVIRPAEPILSIVPDGDAQIVSAAIRPDDVDSISLGQKVRIRVTALGGTTAPELAGRIAYVGASRVTDPDTHQAFYDIRVTIDPASLRAAHVRLRVGMPTELFITTGSRSMLSYLTKPLADQFARAFRDN